jgi:hypothetical protein
MAVGGGLDLGFSGFSTYFFRLLENVRPVETGPETGGKRVYGGKMMGARRVYW